jgi:hypothetical protein
MAFGAGCNENGNIDAVLGEGATMSPTFFR